VMPRHGHTTEVLSFVVRTVPLIDGHLPVTKNPILRV
jgi:hypothetical protein